MADGECRMREKRRGKRGQLWLPRGVRLCDEEGMAKQKNATAVALGGLGGLKGGKSESRGRTTRFTMRRRRDFD